MSSNYNILPGKKLIYVFPQLYKILKSPFYPPWIVLTLEEVKRQQRNQQFYMEIMDIRLAQIEQHIPCIPTMSAPLASSAKDPAPITSLDS